MRTHPRRGALSLATLALALALPGTAGAATLGTIPVDPEGGVMGTFTAPDTQTWSLDLEQARTYAVFGRGACASSVTVRAAGGRLLASFTTPGDDGLEGPSGVSLTAPYTGSYVVQIAADPAVFGNCEQPGDYWLWAARDCAGDASTRCGIAIGGLLRNLRLDYQRDVDWFRVRLAAGHFYRATATAALCPDFAVLDARGSQVAGNDCSKDGAGDQTLTFTAPASGIYHLTVAALSALPESYSLSLTGGATARRGR